MSDNINIQSQSTDPPAEPLTREEQYLSAIAGVTPSSDIPEKPLTRIERYLNKIVENGAGGSGFEPTDEQLAAMNSGITSEDVEQIDTNKNNILSIQNDLYFTNVLPNTNIIEDKIINYANGEEMSNQYTTGNACTDYIPVSAGDIVKLAYVRGKDLCGGAVYDSDKNFIKAIWGTDSWNQPTINTKNEFTFAVNGDIAYLRYTINKDNVYPKNKQYVKIIKAPILEEFVKNTNFITVGKNGIFTTLKSCCDYIKNNNIYGSTVLVQPSVYNLVTEFGNDYLNNITSDDNIGYGLYVGNDTHFIFTEGALVTFIYDGTNPKAAEHFAPFNIYGSCTLENLNVEVTNARYCIHEDVPTTSTEPYFYVVKYINCSMKHNGATVSTGTHSGYACIGAGTNKNTVSIIDGGIYNGNWTADISYHNYNGSAPSKVILNNVYMEHGLRLYDYGNSNVDVTISNCHMPSLTGTYTKFNITSWNNISS